MQYNAPESPDQRSHEWNPHKARPNTSMILDPWIADAERLTARLNPATRAFARSAYLLRGVAPRGIHVKANVFQQPLEQVIDRYAEDAFLVIGRSALGGTPTIWGTDVRSLPRHRPSVTHFFGALPVMVMSRRSARTPIGNAFTLLHQLQHVTEAEEYLLEPGLSGSAETALMGRCERRASQLEIDVLAALDGETFDQHVGEVPITFIHTPMMTKVVFDEEHHPTPAAGTVAHELWLEGDRSRGILRHIGRMAAFERATAAIPPYLANYLTGLMHTDP